MNGKYIKAILLFYLIFGMLEKNLLLVIGGPTASGKTALAIELAQHFDTEIISADSRQFYKEMKIGTARPTLSEMEQAPHHFIGHLSVQEDYSAGQFEREAIQKIEKLFQSKQVVIVVGGSGLFLNAITEGLDEFPEIDPFIRKKLNEDFESKGIQFLQESLKKQDPEYFEVVDKNNPRRLIRALEVIQQSGNTITSFRKDNKKKRSFHSIFLQPHWKRNELYQRIDQRVELMIQNGLVEEVKTLLPFKERQSLKSVGYQEIFDYLENKQDLKKAISAIQQNSRRYAKRQLTWTRQRGQWVFLAKPFIESAIAVIDLVKAGWDWKITSLKPSKSNYQEEEKYSKASLEKNGIKAYFILKRSPKQAQAFFHSDDELSKSHQSFLIGQLKLRAGALPLHIWTESNISIAHFFDFELLKQGRNFPFSDWVKKENDFDIYKVKND